MKKYLRCQQITSVINYHEKQIKITTLDRPTHRKPNISESRIVCSQFFFLIIIIDHVHPARTILSLKEKWKSIMYIQLDLKTVAMMVSEITRPALRDQSEDALSLGINTNIASTTVPALSSQKHMWIEKIIKTENTSSHYKPLEIFFLQMHKNGYDIL